MARIPYVNPETAPVELQPTIELIKRERGGRVSNLFSLLLNPRRRSAFVRFGRESQAQKRPRQNACFHHATRYRRYRRNYITVTAARITV